MNSVPLWLSAARLEEAQLNVPKARALLEQARLKNPKNEASFEVHSVRFVSKLGLKNIGTQFSALSRLMPSP